MRRILHGRVISLDIGDEEERTVTVTIKAGSRLTHNANQRAAVGILLKAMSENKAVELEARQVPPPTP